jgi:hypothetical protein
LRGRPLDLYDTGCHFWVKLQKLKALRPGEKGLSIFRPSENAVLVGKEVSAIDHYRVSRVLDIDAQGSYVDTFAELKAVGQDVACGTFWDYSSKTPTTWANVIRARRCENEGPLLDGLGRRDDMDLGIADGAFGMTKTVAAQTDDPQTRNGDTLPFSGDQVPRLHRNFGHPSPSQLLQLIRQSLGGARAPAVLADAIRTHACEFCARQARTRTPVHPQVAVPHTTGQGQDLHRDIAHFHHPQSGPFLL